MLMENTSEQKATQYQADIERMARRKVENDRAAARAQSNGYKRRTTTAKPKKADRRERYGTPLAPVIANAALSDKTIRVYVAMACYAHKETCDLRMTIAEICKAASNMTRSATNRAIRELKAAKVLKRVSKQREAGRWKVKIHTFGG